MTQVYLRCIFSGLFIFYYAVSGYSQQLAFPGAEGSGCYAKGGRGGTVYEVTNLNNSGAGSIVDALSQGNRTVVFRVSGTIQLNGVILRPKSNTTIAGQTAPGDGICIKGRFHIANGATNIVLRYLRIRVDEGAANSSGDAIDIDNGSNIIIDHVSASYARDEGISCQETSNSVTVQWCIISEALTFESHGYGSLIRGKNGQKKSYHHNLYAHNNGRNPRPGNYTATASDTLGLFFDFRNNVVYNWKGAEPGYNADINATSRYNFIGNVYIPGVESSNTGRIFKESSVDCYAYFADNMYNGSVPADGWSQVTFSSFTTAQVTAYKNRSYLIPLNPITTTSPAAAKSAVLAAVGCSLPKRDIIDNRIINDVLNGTGHSIATTALQPEGGWPQLNSTAAPVDSDHDGMPDTWEIANGLNPNDPEDRNTVAVDGYTMLEKYLNGLTLTDVQEETGNELIADDFVLEQNYPNPFNPVTVIHYSIPERSNTSNTIPVTLKVYDLLGNETAVLVNEEQSVGPHSVKFNASSLGSGVYLYVLKAGNVSKAKKLILMK